jgi:hypothetical protein
MRRGVLSVLVVAAFVLTGCGNGNAALQAGNVRVMRTDLRVGSPWSIRVCGMRLLKDNRTALVPNSFPAFSDDAPGDGDIVPKGATAVAACPTDLGSTNGDLPIEITGRSLASLVSALNTGPAWDSRKGCNADLGWERYLVFGYADDGTLAVLVDSSGCGNADNGAQQRSDGWAKTWDFRLDQVTR